MADPEDDPEPGTPDLRFTEHQQHHVRVERNLSGDGHLARGDQTRMSRLNFTASAVPRGPGERDPVFVDREPASSDEAPPAAAEPPPSPAEPPTPPGLIERLGRWFGRPGS